MLSPLTPDVVFGTGTIKSAFSALRAGFSMKRRSASLLLTFANPSTLPVDTALPASRDMTSLTDSANSAHQTMPALLILDAVLGIGKIRFALSALIDGSSMPTSSACLSMITATNTLTMALALHATPDMNSMEESACQPTLFARPATKMELAPHATLRISFTKETACPSTSLPTFSFTTLSAAPKSLPSLRPLKLAIEMILFDYDNIELLFLIINSLSGPFLNSILNINLKATF